ncbi:MAG: DUF4040 domain-containing protein [Acidimicrobiia bacterium]|nr:DUF4040 domain-containing protein [Acidimicrobiia bacterium]
MLLTVLLYLVVAIVVALTGRTFGSRVFWVAAVGPLWTLGYCVWAASRLGEGARIETWSWVDPLGLTIGFRLDWFSVLLLALIGFIGLLVFIYSVHYFPPDRDIRRTAVTLTLFAGAMTGLVTSDNLFLLFLFWEATSITSFLLIGSNDESSRARSAATQALLVTGAGGLAMLGGFVLIGEVAGTYSMSAILAAPPSGVVVDVALVLVLLGALTKSAQVPFHGWLPAAMAAPTPVSAYLHSATMVKAGVYLVARFAPAFAVDGPWRWIVLSAGSASLILGGYRALRQNDLKLLLAYSTIGQLGLLMILFGVGLPEFALAGCVVLIAHAVFKAALFMVVGIIDHQLHTRDVRRLRGLASHWPMMFWVALLAAASMAGLPPLLGFVGKEEAFDALLGPDAPARLALLIVVVFGSVLTVAYSARFLWGAFGEDVDRVDDAVTLADVPRPSRSFVVAPAVLAAIGLVFGMVPGVMSGLVADSVAALGLGGTEVHLALWHGVNAALGLSFVVVILGAGLFMGRRTVERFQAAVSRGPSASAVHDALLKGIVALAGRVTSVVQSGSLPVYLMVLIVTLVVVPGLPLVLAGTLGRPVDWIDSPMQPVIGLIMVVSAIAAAFVQRRFAAVLLLGTVGYGMAALFIVQGAPDLALTQIMVETLGVVAFVLVLRHLPEGFTPTNLRPRRIGPVVAGVAVGLFVFWFALAASSVSGTPTPSADVISGDVPTRASGERLIDRSLAEEFLARSLPDAHGRNVVNVIIVDFRAFDTLGEITVLLVAALGVLALVRIDRRDPSGDTPNSTESIDPGEVLR